MELSERGSPIEIAILDHSPEIGGAESSLITFLRHVDRRQFMVTVILSGEGRFSRKLAEEGIAVKIIPLPSGLIRLERGGVLRSFLLSLVYFFWIQVFLIKLCLFLKRSRFHLVLTNTVKAHLYGSLVAFLRGIPVAWRFHDILASPDFSPFWVRIVSLFGRFFPEKILAVSQTARDHLIQGGVPSGRVEVIFNGVDDDLLKVRETEATLRKSLKVGEQDRLVGCIGRIVPQKGQKALILAVPKVLRAYPETVFLLVGDTFYRDASYKEELLSLVREKGIEDRIRFTGFRTDVGDLIRCVEIVVCPSVTPESFGLAILEGMFLGKPVIASKVGGVAETIEDGVTGILVDPDQPQQIADRILYLFRNREICDRIGQNAREAVLKRFPLGNYVVAMEKACRALASGEASR